MEKIEQALSFAFRPFLQWDRLRHPYAGWLRVALGVLLPFVFWSHDAVFLIFWLVALFSHPWWFPAYIEIPENMPLMTRLVDAWQGWIENAGTQDKTQLFLPGFALLLPLLWFAWDHNLFWTVYFFAVGAIYKGLFIYRLTQKEGNAQ